ncbi:MAG: Ig-like domain-containing protein [Bacteroidales bacterium]|nr:Ig-like domain-containing protein [Bacteroidales bacterium]
MMRFPLRLSVLGILALAAFGCARQGYPTGGPKDETPPTVLSTNPPNESRHFDGKEFFVQFDEYVVLKNATENVLVSPPMKEKPEFTTKGRGVLVRIKDTLQPNTTYLFQFKDAIADFTEGNLLPSYEYVFSTGEAMDTLSLRGTVVDARSGKPRKETVTVMAYGADDVPSDTMATTEQPLFVTRCDKDGNFAFHYIPEGRYRLVALEDKNANLRVDAAEGVAWDIAPMASHASGDSTAPVAALRLSTPDTRVQRVLKGEFAEQGRIVISTLLPMQSPTATGVEAEWRLNDKRDTLWGWCLDAKRDSAVVVLADAGINDTLRLRYTAKRSGGRRQAAVRQETMPLMRSLCSGTTAFYDELWMAFDRPVTEIGDSAMAEVMNLKDSTVGHWPVKLDSSGLKARIDAPLHSGETYSVFLREGLFADLYGTRSDSLRFSLTPRDYGTLSIDIANHTGKALVVEVMDSRDTVVQQQRLEGSGRLRFIHLKGGDYRLRAVVDTDGDGCWTPGDYRRQRQPEEAVMFHKTLSLREKWEMEERWEVDTLPFGSLRRTQAMPAKSVDIQRP